MNVKEYIESGILELYVAGLLSEEENLEVHQYVREYPEIREEIEQIEAAILELSRHSKPLGKSPDFEAVRAVIESRRGSDIPVRTIADKRSGKSWITYTGWAASVILAGGLLYMIQQNSGLKQQIQTEQGQVELLEQEINEARSSAENYQELLEKLRARDVRVIPLPGQGSFEQSFAKAYLDENSGEVLIDAAGLPEPPEGMVYQVWSLKLSPLTPTSIGLLENFQADDNKIFALNALEGTEAFGITLEPAGGSETPTMEQLYTLGVINS